MRANEYLHLLIFVSAMLSYTAFFLAGLQFCFTNFK